MNTNTEFASAGYTAGQLNAIVKGLKKQAGEDGPEKFLRGEVTVSQPACRWRELDGVIYFSVTSDGTTGPEWINRLDQKGFRLNQYSKSVLNSVDFKSTTGVTTEIAVLKGMLFSDENRTTKKIRAEADQRKLGKPNAEVGCLIRENFSDEQIEAMNLWGIIAMHDPINDSDGDPLLLGAYRDNDGRRLNAYFVSPGHGWDRGNGFAFAVSQSST